METVDFVNASDFFNAIELGDVESEMFLDTVVLRYELNGLFLTGRSVFVWCLKKFIAECEDIYEKDVMMQSLKEFNFGLLGGIKHVNIEG